MEKQKRMYSIALVSLYILAFIPVIKGSFTLLGISANYQVNISNLNFGLGFNLIFLGLTIFGLFALHFRPKLRKISDWTIIILLALLLILIVIAKDGSESLAIGYFVLWLDWLSIVLLRFKPSIMEKIYDGIVSVKNKLVKLLEEKPSESVEEQVEPAE